MFLCDAYPTECSGPPHLLGPWGRRSRFGIDGLLVPFAKARPTPNFTSKNHAQKNRLEGGS